MTESPRCRGNLTAITIMVPTTDGWSLQQPPDPAKALKSKINQFPNRAARRRRR